MLLRWVPAVFAAVALGAFAAPAEATTYSVDPSAADNATGSLRYYVGQANANPGADVINVPAGSFQLLHAGVGEDANATGDLDVTDTLTVRGAGQADTTLGGVAADRIFDLHGTGTTLTLTDMTMRQGIETTGSAVNAGDGSGLTIERCLFTGNNASAAGTVAVKSAQPFALTVTDSTFDTNNVGRTSVANSVGRGVLYISTAVPESPVTAAVTRTKFTNNRVGGIVDAVARGVIYVNANSTAPSTAAFDHIDVSNNTLGGGEGRGSTGAGAGFGPAYVVGSVSARATFTDSSFTGNTLGGGGSSHGPGGEGQGGGILDGVPALVVKRSRFANNTLGGGALGASTGRGGRAYGGGIYSLDSASVDINGSTFADNSAGGTTGVGYGGGLTVASAGGPATVTDSTFARNVAGGGAVGIGGGIWLGGDSAAQFTLRNLTLDGNQAGPTANPIDSDGGAVYAAPAAGSPAAALSHLTVTNNHLASGGTKIASGLSVNGPATLANSVFAGNTRAGAPANCTGQVTSSGGNIEEGASSCAPAGAPSTVADPQLGPLGDNGGPVFTRVPLAGSPAIDTGVLGSCAPDDARGLPRPSGPGCDSGAVEVQQPSPPPAAPGPPPDAPAGPGTPLAINSLSAGGKRFQQGKPITFAYGLSRAASVKLAFIQQVPGHRKNAKAKCRKSLKKGKRCTIATTRGSLAQSGAVGANKLKFSGKLKRRKLPLGRYQAVLTASAVGEKPVKRTVNLTIVKPKRKKK